MKTLTGFGDTAFYDFCAALVFGNVFVASPELMEKRDA